MFDIRCDLPALSREGPCNWLSFKVGDHGIEIRCPRCRRIHTVTWDRILGQVQTAVLAATT